MTWKKYAEDEWMHKKDKYSYIRVWKVGLSAKERKKRGINAFGFSGRVGRNGIETKKFFKRKPEAIKFAKSYMKIHC